MHDVAAHVALPAAVEASAPRSPRAPHSWRGVALRYGLGVGSVVAAHGVVYATWRYIGPALYTVFLAAVVIAVLYGGRGPGLLATLLVALDLCYTFMPPYNAFEVDFQNFLYLCAFLIVALVTSSLQAGRRRAEESLRAAHAELERRVRDRTDALVRSQEQFSLLVNGVGDQAFFMLDGEGNVASWNAGAERLLGYASADVLGRGLARIWPERGDALPGGGEDGPRAATAAAAEADRHECQGWIVRGDASRFWAGIVVTQVHDPGGRARGYAVAVRDMTERKGLERDILEISERERERIGHDLHDGLGQELTGVALLSTALAEQLAAGGAGGAEHAERVADLVHDAIRHARELARGLCPVDLEDEGLPSALRQLADAVARLPNIECACDAPDRVRVAAPVAAHLYRIAQEAINNAVRHGKARRIGVRLSDAGGRLTLVVSDDGVGFPESGRGSGMGLRLMSYRARAIRGSLDIRRTDPRGTAVTCTLDPSSEEANHG